MVIALEQELVSEPFEHERYGLSVQVHPTVELGRNGRFPSQAVVITTAARKLIELSKGGVKIKAILVHSDGRDPMLHPEFREISENLRELVRKWFPRAQMILSASSLHLEDHQARHALNSYDRPVLRFSAGTQKVFGMVTGEKPNQLTKVVDNLCRIEHEHLVILARFTRGEVDNSTDNELKAWMKHIERVKPSTVEITTPAKAHKNGGKPVTKTRMKTIAETLADKTGIPVEILE